MENELLQMALRFNGYGDLCIDGIYGDATEAAVRDAQVHFGIAADGAYGPVTHAYLSEETRARQRLLAVAGYYDAAVDGIVGELTDGGVRRFQREHGLTADGIIGPLTEAALADATGHIDPYATPNFTDDEFKCPCGCGGDVIRPMKCKLQRIRDALGAPVIITSGFRCPPQNVVEGGIDGSLHCEGMAVDFYTPGMDVDRVDELAALAHNEDLTAGTYYASLFVHAQIGRSDFVGD